MNKPNTVQANYDVNRQMNKSSEVCSMPSLIQRYLYNNSLAFISLAVNSIPSLWHSHGISKK